MHIADRGLGHLGANAIVGGGISHVVGAGLTYQLTDERSVDVNANFFHVGEAPVDTGNGEPGFGRVVGENKDPYAFMFELTYHL